MSSQPQFDLSHIVENTKPEFNRKRVPEETWLQVKEMWAMGLSGSEIARKIGVTRNVVIGLIHRRLGGGARGTFRTTGVRVYSERSPRLARTYLPRLKAVNPAAPPQPEPPPKAVKADEKGLMDIRYGRHCCYPVGGAGADTIYCGGPTGGKNYCPEHGAIMHNPAKANKGEVPGVSLTAQGYVSDPTKGKGKTKAEELRKVYFGGGRV